LDEQFRGHDIMKKLAKNGTCWAAFFPSCARPVKLKQGTVAVTL